MMVTRRLRIGWPSWPQGAATSRSCGGWWTTGNENAADRLAELAAERGDLEQLQRLVDDGNDNAADRLAQLAAERGDLEQLQRLVDEGNESAESLLSELIRKIK